MARTGRPREFDEDAVVDAAMTWFWEHGYEATSVQDVLDTAGIARASLYGTFGDKHGLFLRALGRYVELTAAAARGLADDGPVLPRLRDTLTAILRSVPGVPPRGCLLGNTAVELAPVDVAAAEAVRTGFAHLENGFRAALLRAYDSGELPRRDADAQARLLLVVFQGLQVVARTERDPTRLADAVDAALGALR